MEKGLGCHGFPWEYVVPVKQAHTFEVAIWTSRFVEDMIKKRTAENIEVGEKTKNEGLQTPKKEKILEIVPQK